MKRIAAISIVSIATIAYLLNSQSVNAQGVSLSVYPPVIEIQTTPPSSPIVPIFIQNNNEEEVNLQIQLIPFTTNNASGDIILTPLVAKKGLNPYIIERIQFLLDGKKTDTVTLQPLETKKIELNVNLAKGDPQGDYYYSIVFINRGIENTQSSRSQIPVGLATNLLLSIGPKETSSGGISQFYTSFFKTHGPVEFNLKLHNSSKHLISPTGKVEVTNLFGQKVGNVKILPQYVIAGADRYLVNSADSSSIKWPENFLLGWYKATATIYLDENGIPLKSYTYFAAFPLSFFVGLAIMIFLGLSVYLRVRKKI